MLDFVDLEIKFHVKTFSSKVIYKNLMRPLSKESSFKV